MTMSYVIYIRCRIIWLSLAMAFLLVVVVTNAAAVSRAELVVGSSSSSSSTNFTTTSTNDAKIVEGNEGEEDMTYENLQLPSDGHLNSHEGEMIGGDVDCKCRQHTTVTTPKNAPRQSSSNGDRGRRIRIFYLILLHNIHTIREAIHLFRAIRGSPHIIVFHVDKKVEIALQKLDEGEEDKDKDNDNDLLQLQSSLQSLKDEILSCPCGSVVDIQSVHKVEWSKWSMNLPTLWGIQLAATSATYKGRWDTFVNLSGDTLPVYTPNTMSRILFYLRQYNFVTSRSCETGLVPTNVYSFPKSWHKRKHYTNADKDPPPVIQHYTTTEDDGAKNQSSTTTIINYYFGSQWVILQRDFVDYLANALQHNNSFVCRYRDHLLHKGKVMTDETFLPTVLMHVSPYNETTLPQLYEDGPFKGSVVYQDYDYNNQNDDFSLPPIYSIRYERMDEHFPSPLRGYYPKHPRYEVPTTTNKDVDVHQDGSSLLLPPNPHNWGPYYLGLYDLEDIIDSGALFVRKTSSVIDPNLIRLLPVDRRSEIPKITWPPYGIQTSAVPNWKHDKLQLMKHAVQQAQKEGQSIPSNFEKEIKRLENKEEGGKHTTTSSSNGKTVVEDEKRQQQQQQQHVETGGEIVDGQTKEGEEKDGGRQKLLSDTARRELEVVQPEDEQEKEEEAVVDL